MQTRLDEINLVIIENLTVKRVAVVYAKLYNSQFVNDNG